jgi:hypothetical protein
VALRWRLADGSDVSISRSPGKNGGTSVVYDGSGSAFADRTVENYVRDRYTITGQDAAGNTITRSAVATPRPALFAPRPGAHVAVHGAPLLAWRPAPKARYYNVQLWLDGRAIGSWWPGRARLRLPSRWRFGGESHRLEAGTYTWYVWPGRGPRRLGRYGQMLGKSTFVVG